ncbi:NADH dehydrogenase-like protein [Planctomycetes bacterium Pan216]|uniref:NADH dehydrogenase-like protein n=1 Tax=Kolteria novifilia TaxID=2527975 RepID=A0A518B925_9BACT|nr:NADH dehydrogenase-like protein [Planctomycetes bacterium Pan216]
MERHRVVVVGGGFGGLYATTSLRHAPVQVTLLDRRNFHLFQPLLYQVATGALSPANIAAPLRSILRSQQNARVLLGNVDTVDVEAKEVRLAEGRAIPYDSLIVAAGARHSYFGHDEWEGVAPGLKTIEDATEIRRRILLAFETAERLTDPAPRAAWLTFVVVGAGPTGLEMAGAIAEIAFHTLRHDFRSIDSSKARVVLLDGSDRVLPPYPEDLSGHALRLLEDLGIEIRTKTLVTDITPDRVVMRTPAGTEELATHTVIWAAGVQASSLASRIAKATGAPRDRAGRLHVDPFLCLPEHPEIFVIGDMAHCVDDEGKPLPGIAPVAMQQGSYVADLIKARLDDDPREPFEYHDRGSMATIGRRAAVANLGWAHVHGSLAWMLWLFVHLMYIVQFQSRMLVLVQWAWNYVTRNRSARLITGTSKTPLQPNEPDVPEDAAASLN